MHHVAAIDRRDVVTVDGIRTTGLARTLADLGSVVDPTAVRRALTDARRRRTSLGWLRDTAERLHRPGQAGTGTLLRSLDATPLEGRVPGSWFEELVAMCLHDPGLPPAVPQYEIRDTGGRHRRTHRDDAHHSGVTGPTDDELCRQEIEHASLRSEFAVAQGGLPMVAGQRSKTISEISTVSLGWSSGS